LARAREEQVKTGEPLLTTLSRLGLLDDSGRVRIAAARAGLEYVELAAYAVDTTAAAVFPEAFARARRIAAIGWLDSRPIVATSTPADVQLLDDARLTAGRDIHLVAAAAADIERYNERLYEQDSKDAHGRGTAGRLTDQSSLPGAVLTPPTPARDAQTTVALPPPPPRPAGGATSTLEAILVRSGKLGQERVKALLDERNSTGKSLREIIAERRLVPEVDLYHAVADEAGLEFVDLNDWDIDQRAAERVPESLARRYQVLSIGFTDAGLPIVGMVNPSDVFALDDLRTLLGREIETVVCAPSQIADYLPRLYRQTREADLMAKNAAMAAAPVTEIRNLPNIVEDGPIVQFVNLILRQALAQRASDVHIEPTADDVQVRFRIDGVLHHITNTPKTIQGGVTSRLKVMADLDIAEHRVPQDGRISLNFGNREIDLRVATLPTVHGEMIALRILDKASATLDVMKLGFDKDVLTAYESAYRKPYGTILVTGPTGSGKSTTLYATLNQLNSPERKLITVEDPVEYQLRGINQIQVSTKAGLSFASALRSILRSDPDVILVGEIRDRETATIAIEAALTGHLVLSSLHTNDAAGTPMRLVEMGLEAFLVGSALDCVVGQRLARVLCLNCSEPYEPSEEELEAAGWEERDAPPDEPAAFRRPVGCQACSRTGYRGRMALHEVMLLSEEIERAVVTHAQSAEIQRIAEEQGMRTLRRDGLRKAARGLTSLEEILRVVA
jgi:type IV pilus assembly protein PilB